ncbi:MAG: DUF2029 domain-containing protein, partial [Myxococcales bacterium]|nr:DUF2029 domain-containing protein [Myxococcales bacterium]
AAQRQVWNTGGAVAVKLIRTARFFRVLVPALAVALGITWVAFVTLSDGASSPTGRLGGDFPAFYGAGRLILEGRATDLYTPGAQADAQVGLFPDSPPPSTGTSALQPEQSHRGFLMFAYPPYVAAAYAPLAALPYRAAYAVHTLFMALCLLAAVWIAGLEVPLVARHRGLVFSASLLFYPAFESIRGGQNATLTLLLVALLWRTLSRQKYAWAGLLLAALLFKPQFAAAFLLVTLAVGAWRVLPTFALGAAAFWGLGAAVSGVGWAPPWWRWAAAFRTYDAGLNAGIAISLPGLLEGVAPTLGYPFDPTASWVLSSLLLGFGLGAVGFGRSRFPSVSKGAWIAIAAPWIVFSLPHAMHYDAAVALVAGYVAVGQRWRCCRVAAARRRGFLGLRPQRGDP